MRSTNDVEAETTPAEEELETAVVTAAGSGGLAAPQDTTDDSGSDMLDIDSGVVEKIVAITCRSVDGILQMKGNFISSLQEGFGGTDITKGVQVEMVGVDSCNVGVSIIMEYGKSAKKIYTELRSRISEKVGDMTGLTVLGVRVRVVDVMTREELEGSRRASRRREDGSETDASTDQDVNA